MPETVPTPGAPAAERRTRDLLGGLGLLLALPLWLWWAVYDGGYQVTVFAPGLVFLACAGAVLARSLPARLPGGASRVALGCLGGLAALACLSTLWAQDKGLAWAGGTRTTLLALAFALPVLWPVTERALRTGLLALVGASGCAAASGIVTAFGGGAALADGRLTDPTNYANATAAIVLIGAVAAVPLTTDRSSGPAVRALLCGAVCALAGAAVLTQSRGAVAALAVAVVVAVALTPRRWSALAVVAVGGVALAAAMPALLDVRTAALAGDADDALAEAAFALVAVFLAGAGSGFALTRLDGVTPPPRLSRLSRSRKVRRKAAGCLLVVALVAAAVAGGDAASWVGDRASDLSAPDYSELEEADSRFTGDLGSNRVDYWRAAMDVLGDDPVAGVGEGGFAEAYLVRRRTDLSPLFAHSMWLQAAADLGALGLGLLLGFAAALALALARAWRCSAATGRTLVAACAGPVALVAVHGSADWIAAFAGVLVPVLGLAGAATSIGRPTAGRGRRSALRTPAAAVVIAALAVVTLASVPLLLSARYQARGGERAARAPAAALADFERAGRLNPLSPAPSLNEGIAALRAGDERRALAAFTESVRRNGGAWFPQLMSGVLLAANGQMDEAARRLDAAVAANPRNARIRRIRATVMVDRSVVPAAVLQSILRESK